MSESSINAAIDSLVSTFNQQVTALRDEVAKTFQTQPPADNEITVSPGDDVQAALESLFATGGVLKCAPGKYVTNLTLKPRSSKAVIEMVSTSHADPGRPLSSERMPLFVAQDPYKSVLRALPGSSGLHCTGLAFGPQAPDRALVELGADKHTVTKVADVPKDIAFESCLFEGDRTAGQHRAISLNAADVRISNCTFADFHEVGRDSQAICGWNGTARILIENCWIEAGAENVLFGGGDSATAELMPRDVTIVGCTFTKNYAWMSLPKPPVIKCLFEVKALVNLTVTDCVFEHCWKRDWPTGVAIVIKSANQENTAPWSTCKNIKIENCQIRDVGAVFQIVGQNDGTAGNVSTRGQGLTYKNILAYNINQGTFLGTGKGFEILNAPDDLVVDHLTMLGANNCILTASYANSVPRKATGFKFTNSVVHQGAYGLHSPSGLGTVALDATFDSWIFKANAIRKDPARKITFPPDNPVLEQVAFDSSLVNYEVTAGSAIDKAVTTTDGTVPGVDLS